MDFPVDVSLSLHSLLRSLSPPTDLCHHPVIRLTSTQTRVHVVRLYFLFHLSIWLYLHTTHVSSSHQLYNKPWYLVEWVLTTGTSPSVSYCWTFAFSSVLESAGQFPHPYPHILTCWYFDRDCMKSTVNLRNCHLKIFKILSILLHKHGKFTCLFSNIFQ